MIQNVDSKLGYNESQLHCCIVDYDVSMGGVNVFELMCSY